MGDQLHSLVPLRTLCMKRRGSSLAWTKGRSRDSIAKKYLPYPPSHSRARRAPPLAARWAPSSDYRSSGEDFTVHEDQSIPLAVSESNLGARSAAYSYLSSVAASRIGGEPSSARTGPGQGSGHKSDIMGPGGLRKARA